MSQPALPLADEMPMAASSPERTFGHLGVKVNNNTIRLKLSEIHAIKERAAPEAAERY
jgi:hypothetical protein